VGSNARIGAGKMHAFRCTWSTDTAAPHALYWKSGNYQTKELYKDMMTRYNSSDNWYKGNTHIHSTASDGGWTFEELESAYAGAGYDFLFRTDHWVCSDAQSDRADSPLLWLDGIELDGFDEQDSYYHVVCLGRFVGLSRDMGFSAALAAARVQGGLLILAHPCWTGNSFEEATRRDYDGVEVYNHVCQWLNGKGDNLAY
jgi:hypothetical protein